MRTILHLQREPVVTAESELCARFGWYDCCIWKKSVWGRLFNYSCFNMEVIAALSELGRAICWLLKEEEGRNAGFMDADRSVYEFVVGSCCSMAPLVLTYLVRVARRTCLSGGSG